MVHPTEIRTLISPSSAVELNTTSALANYATEAVLRDSRFSLQAESWPRKNIRYILFSLVKVQLVTKLSRYNFTTHQIVGKLNVVADALSRMSEDKDPIGYIEEGNSLFVIHTIPESLISIRDHQRVWAILKTPRVVVSDNGPYFKSRAFRDMCFSWEIKHVTTSPYNPSYNHVERFNRNLNIAFMVFHHQDHSRWDQHMELLNFVFNATFHVPILDYACPTWGHLVDTQSKCLRIIVDAPCQFRNMTMHRDLEVPTIKDHLRKLPQSFYDRLPGATNPFIQGLGNYVIEPRGSSDASAAPREDYSKELEDSAWTAKSTSPSGHHKLNGSKTLYTTVSGPSVNGLLTQAKELEDIFKTYDRGGGTAVMIKFQLPPYQHHFQNLQYIEATAININSNGIVRFMAIYKPPTKTLLPQDFDDITDVDQLFLADTHDDIVVASDEPTHCPPNYFHRPDIIYMALTNIRVTPEDMTILKELDLDLNPILHWDEFRITLKDTLPELQVIDTIEQADATIQLFTTTTHRTPQHRTLYNRLRAQVRRRIKDIKLNNWNTYVTETPLDRYSLWEVTQQLRGNTRIKTVPAIHGEHGMAYDSAEMAEAIAMTQQWTVKSKRSSVVAYSRVKRAEENNISVDLGSRGT
uniref:Integrase catalytic domain-containing protein n=1 Tax=Timema douglasi TaxID=61478 RepID=A0A7R8Z880_TIMDO|nr:unnamed protein product [Timema douglasi]